VGLRSPPGDHLAVSGRLFVELDDGRRLRATGGTVRASYGDFFRKRRVSRQDVEKSILGLVGKDPDRTRPPRLAWEQLSGVLAQEGLRLSDDELVRLPFDVEFSDELVRELDRS
jgi:hypothetical protein